MKLPHVRQIVISLFLRWGRGGSRRWSPLLKTQREAGISSWIVFLQSLGFDPLYPAVPSPCLWASYPKADPPGGPRGTNLQERRPVMRRGRSRIRRRHNTCSPCSDGDTWWAPSMWDNPLRLSLTVNCPPINGLTKMDSQGSRQNEAFSGVSWGKEAVGLLVNAWG